MPDFHSQAPAWEPGDFDPRVEVAEITVPLSYADPDGATITVAVSRIRCADPAQRRGVLLTLNGGPAGNWGGGIKLPLRLAATPLNRYYDIVGMDPRGTGRSTPLWREDPAPTAPFTTRPTDEDLAAIVTDVRTLAQACEVGGPLREQITSANIARDIDVLRGVLGEDKISYVGYGDPTYNGAVYATMFPAAVDRMVLDSSRNPDVGWRGQFRSQVDAVYDSVAAWAQWVADRDRRFGLGTLPGAVLAATERAAAATYTPAFDIAMGIGTRHRPLWAVTADIVAQLENDGADAEATADAREAVQKLAGLDAWSPRERQGRLQSVTEAATAEDHWPADLEEYLRDMRVAREKFPYGYGVLRFQPQVATFWQDRRIEAPPAIRREGFAPGVVVHGTGNTMLRHAGGAAMAERLGFSLVSVTDEGHNEIFAVRGNKDVDDLVYAYLIDGVQPPARVICAGPARPDIAPDSAGGTTGSGAGTLTVQVDEWIATNRAW